jgi:chaperonin GroEL (HSP60 family)
VDDAICAVRASKDGGVVAGGGITCIILNDFRFRYVTSKICSSLFYKIMQNAGKENQFGNYPMGWMIKIIKK